jgi:rubrerythrin
MFGKKKSGSYVSAGRVLRRLAEIEQDGVEFYQGLMEGTKLDFVRKLAAKMVRAEDRHRRRFLGYAEEAERSAGGDLDQLAKPLPPEVVRLLGVRIMVDKARVKQSALYATDEEALRVAIRAEEHIALLLTQLREYVAPAQRGYISRVIKEEWNHKARLEEMYQGRVMKAR